MTFLLIKLIAYALGILFVFLSIQKIEEEPAFAIALAISASFVAPLIAVIYSLVLLAGIIRDRLKSQ